MSKKSKKRNAEGHEVEVDDNEVPFEFDSPPDISEEENKHLLYEGVAQEQHDESVADANQEASEVAPTDVENQVQPAIAHVNTLRKVVDPEKLVGFAGRDENGEGFETPSTEESSEGEKEDYLERSAK